MKIVVLNECFLQNDHIARLKRLGELQVYTDTITEQQTIERLRNADVAIADCFVAPLNKTVFDNTHTLKYVTVNSTGFDAIDLEAAKAKNILLSNIPEYTTEAVAEFALALMLATTRHIVQMNKRVHEKPYEIDPVDTLQLPLLGFDLQGKTLGIIGLGRIGQRVAAIAQGFGMKILAYNRSPKNIPTITQVSLEEVMRRSDVVSIHTPLTPETENMIGEKELALMRPHAVIINTARGKIIDTQALAKVLEDKKIGGAGIDTLANWDKQNPLLLFENVIVTPHGAWYTKETLKNMANTIVENVEAYAKGQPKNLISL